MILSAIKCRKSFVDTIKSGIFGGGKYDSYVMEVY